MFQGNGRVSYHGFVSPFFYVNVVLVVLINDMAGFEYNTDRKNPTGGYITWQTGGVKTARLGAKAMRPDMGDGGSQVGQRLIQEEAMALVFNLGKSCAYFFF
jgi:hypothetical protein